jgi:uncharacterized protein (DUF2141 family)
MRAIYFAIIVVAATALATAVQPGGQAAAAGPRYTLTLTVTGVDEKGGNIGVLVFKSSQGWADDRQAALKDIVVAAHPETVTVTVPDLPAGEYAVSIAHDVNQNHKLDKNWVGKPTEQWGLSNNPHATIKTPSYNACKFTLKGDMELHITMQM